MIEDIIILFGALATVPDAVVVASVVDLVEVVKFSLTRIDRDYEKFLSILSLNLR